MNPLYTLLQFLGFVAAYALLYFTPPVLSYLLLAFFILRILLFLRPSTGTPIPPTKEDKTALLVVDFQEALCGVDGFYPGRDPFRERVLAHVESARAAGIEVIFIRQEFPLLDLPFCLLAMGGRLLKGTPGAAICPGFLKAEDGVFIKHQQDAFSGTKLGQHLKERGITTLSIVGLDASSCVLKTALGAKNRGYSVTLHPDAVLGRSKAATQKALKMMTSKGLTLLD